MQKLFNKILVPVNFNSNTSLALDKAIQLANRFNCDIHLLHVQIHARSIPFFYGVFVSNSSSEKRLNQLKKLEDRCKSKLHDGLLMTSTIVKGNWQSVLKQTIITEHIDLVVIPKNRRRFSSALIKKIDLNRLTEQTRCPVLTVTRKFNVSHLQNIVVPINDFIPVRKLTIATYLCREVHGSIHLMGTEGSSSRGRAKEKYLIKAFQLLNDYGHVKIHCSLPENFHNSTSTLAYAKNVNADLIVVTTGNESLLRGWWNKLIGKYLYKNSDIPVLTIA
jgi:nucleotide-binding universal stress UspA family protein